MDKDEVLVDRGDGLDVDPDNPDGELIPETVETTPAPKKDPEKAPEEPEHAKEPRIPLTRHKEILEKERAQRAELEARVAQYEKGQKVAVFNEDITALETEIAKLDKEYLRLLADGELDKAADVQEKMRGMERKANDAKSDMKVAAAVAQATERARYDIVLERIEAAYPELDPDGDKYDERIMARVVKMHSANQRSGMPPAASLQDAVTFVLGDPKTKAQERAVLVSPRPSQADVAAERREAAVGKTLDATRRTPPSTSKVGMDSDKMGTLTAKDIMKMSQDDFAKIPEDVLSRMRGDEL